MTAQIQRLRERAGDSEKITINLGYVDLGHIDLLVQESFYSNRTDFIRTAMRNLLATHREGGQAIHRAAHARARSQALHARGFEGREGRW